MRKLLKVLLKQPLISRRWLSIIVVMLICFTLSSCQYSPPYWRTEGHYLISRDAQKFVVMANSEMVRQPEGFIAQFPDGGTDILVEQRISVWQFDPRTLAFIRLAELQRPTDIHSRILGTYLYGWDEEGSLYVALNGNKGRTSDTPKVTHVFRIAPGSVTEVPSAPDVRESVQQGPDIDLKLWILLDQPWHGRDNPITVSMKSRYEDSYLAIWEIAADGSGVHRIGYRFKQWR